MHVLIFAIGVFVSFFCFYFLLRKRERRYLKAKENLRLGKSEFKNLLSIEKRLRGLIELSD